MHFTDKRIVASTYAYTESEKGRGLGQRWLTTVPMYDIHHSCRALVQSRPSAQQFSQANPLEMCRRDHPILVPASRPVVDRDHLVEPGATQGRRGGRFDPEGARWRLWWEGWLVDPEQIRTRLTTTEDAWDHALATFRAAMDDGDVDDALTLFTESRLPYPVLGRARQRAGGEAFATLA